MECITCYIIATSHFYNTYHDMYLLGYSMQLSIIKINVRWVYSMSHIIIITIIKTLPPEGIATYDR